MSKFADRLKRLHHSRVRASEASARAEEDRAGVYHADDVAELSTSPDAADSRDGSSRSRAPAGGRSAERDAWKAVGASNLNDHYWLDNRLDPGSRHGRFSVADIAQLDLPALSRELLGLFASSAGVADAVFVDIETAGLGEGAGNEAWCIGIGRLRGDSFVVRHHVLVHPDLEPQLLRAVAQDLDEARVLVTFNGQAFDLPRLRSHFERHGIDDPTVGTDHIDLLKVVRRLVPSDDGATLVAAERALLGFIRRHDVPGAESPRRWSRYLATLNVRPLLPLIEHNKLDIVSLAILLVHCESVLSSERPRPKELDRTRPKREAPVRNREPRPENPKPKQASEPSEFRKKLVRSYRLKNRSGDADNRTRRRPRQVVERANLPDDAPTETSAAPVGERLAELRRAASRLLEQGDDTQAIPLLHEMLALSPRNPFPLAELARYYRDLGDAELANLFESRLRDVAPY